MSDGIKMSLPTAVQGPSFTGYSSRAINRESQNKELNIEKVAQDFESFLIFNMIKEMGKTTCGPKKSCTEQTYMSLMYEKMGDYLSKKGLGIKDMLIKYAEDRNIKVLKEKGDNVVK
jgi:Rod binding domain-containing protein